MLLVIAPFVMEDGVSLSSVRRLSASMCLKQGGSSSLVYLFTIINAYKYNFLIQENVLNEALSMDLKLAIEKVEGDDSVKSIVLMSNKPGSFIAGADVNMLKKAKSATDGESISRYEWENKNLKVYFHFEILFSRVVYLCRYEISLIL
uniref:Enoyl-CoA hydratase n=1 Tax=Heterorhabditis bacteriophora TaxID=37862 RepID=A0A1I7WG96_HETBA